MTSFTRSAKTLIIQIISSVQHYLPSKSLLIFLLILDNWLYYLQGQTAIAYGNGLHPKHRLTGYHDFFTNRIQPEERVLDVGCGIGYLAFDVAEKTGAFVLGVDINPLDLGSLASSAERQCASAATNIQDPLSSLDMPHKPIVRSVHTSKRQQTDTHLIPAWGRFQNPHEDVRTHSLVLAGALGHAQPAGEVSAVCAKRAVPPHHRRVGRSPGTPFAHHARHCPTPGPPSAVGQSHDERLPPTPPR